MRTMIQAAALCMIAGTAIAQTPIPVQPVCPVTAQPIPTGLNERPGEKIGQPQTPEQYGAQQDYLWIHSSTNLQGYPTKEKHAPCLFYNPREDDLAKQLGGFESAFVINNPAGNAQANVRVILYDRNGVQLTTLSRTLQPNETWHRGVPELATLGRGVGSARIVSDVPVVGSTLHHVNSVVIGGNRLVDTHPLHPGANSQQQLQAAQGVGVNLYAGPMPLSNRSAFDFLNGNLPFYCVRNTGTTPTTITAYKGTSSGILLPTLTATLPGDGMFIDLSLWQAAEPFYVANTSIDENAWAWVTSNNHSLVGDLILTDFFRYGSPASPQMSPGKRFRMGSAMMANSPSYNVTSAEVTQQLGPIGPRLDTMIGVLNASTVDIGPVTVTYRNRNGAVVGTNTIGTLPAGQTLRLTPGTPGFPAAPFFAGWADIRACKPGLIGWTMREVTAPDGPSPHFEKAYGEELAGANGREPGNGLRTTVAGVQVTRKVVSLARRMTSLPWPSYHTFANNSVSNIGNYWHRFHDLPGNDITNYTNQPFLGLQFGRTSFTYQDGWINPLVTPGTNNMSGRVDVSNGSVIGMSAIGDPMNEWLIPGYAGTPLSE